MYFDEILGQNYAFVAKKNPKNGNNLTKKFGLKKNSPKCGFCQIGEKIPAKIGKSPGKKNRNFTKIKKTQRKTHKRKWVCVPPVSECTKSAKRGLENPFLSQQV